MAKHIKTKEDKKKEKKEEKKKEVPKEISQEILKKIFGNLLRAVGIMAYFILLNLAHSTMRQERLVGDIEVFAGTFLIVGIIFLEKAYHRDNTSIGIIGIEFLFLSLHSLSIMHVITLFKYDFRIYLLTSSYLFAIYYVLKAIILYTKGRKDYLDSLSDISEIVKKEEPIKKEAKKRKEEIRENIDEEEEKKEEILETEIEKTIEKVEQSEFQQVNKGKRLKKNRNKRGKKKKR
ncbi:MAG: hypothetical protein HFJ35_05425 [Clostridia bacterium]|nr:hypothetical protein [Clostridia bacterium]